MITREESGFTQEVYDQLNQHLGSASVELTVRQRNLDFSLHSVYTDRGKLWDACQANNKLYRVYIASGTLYLTTLDNEDSGTQEWSTPEEIDTGVDDIPPSIYQGTVIYYVKNGDISRAVYGLGIWSVTNAWAEAPYGTIQYVAGGGLATVHMAVWRSDYNTEFFTVTDAVVAESGILIPHQITGFSAINGPVDPEFGDTPNIIAMSLDLPVQIGTRATGSQVDHIAYRSNGILSFLYQRGTWSDHFFVERFDDASDWQYRKHVKLSALPNGHYALVAFGKDGYENDPHDSLHYYFSGNGKFWESPWLFRTAGISYGGKLLVNGNYAYMVSTSVTSRSYATELVTEDIPDAITLDITSHLSSYESSMAEGRQTALLLRNEDSWYEDSMLAEPGVYSLITRWGIRSNKQQVAHEIIEVCSPTKDTPAKEVVIKARDFMSLLNTHVRAAHPRIYDTQVVGGDEYNDITGTTYGGLQHTAGVLGSWSTEEGWLLARRNNSRALAYKTFKVDIWNGSIQAKVNPQLGKPNKPNQFIGLVWRGYDKDNYYSFEYHVTTRQLRLNEMRAGVKTQLVPAISGINWVRAQRYMRVRFRYSHVICEWSVNGTTWTVAFDEILPGKEPVETGDQPVVVEEGQVGLTARGFAAGDMYKVDPYSYNDIPAIDPSIPEEDVDYEGSPDTEEEATETQNDMPGGRNNFAVIDFIRRVRKTSNFLSSPPTWGDYVTISGMTGYIDLFRPDPYSPAYQGSGSEVNGWATTDGKHIWRVTDVFGSPSAELVHEISIVWALTESIDMKVSKCSQNHVVIVGNPDYIGHDNNNTVVIWTIDGETWHEYQFPVETTYFDIHSSVEISPDIPGMVTVTATRETSPRTETTYRSIQYGASFSECLTSGPHPIVEGRISYLHIPDNNSDDDRIAYYSYAFGDSLYKVVGESVSVLSDEPLWRQPYRMEAISSYHGNRNIIGYLYGTGNARTVRLTSDGGENWNDVAGSPSGEELVGIRISDTDPSAVYIWSNGKLWYSDDFSTFESKLSVGSVRGFCVGAT